MINRIEVEFAIPVEINDRQMGLLDRCIQAIAKDNEPEGMVHWCSGVGSKPSFSQADQRFLGKEVDSSAPLTGEPTFDHSILHFETCCRERYESEKGGSKI